MLAIAGTTALLLGVIGVYGVIAYAVTQRTREIGIRVALGARPAAIQRMFVGNGLRLGVVGVVCGLTLALAMTRWMSSLLFGISPSIRRRMLRRLWSARGCGYRQLRSCTS